MNSINNINSNSEQAIPKHWQLKKLGEVGEIISGGTPSTKVAAYWNGTISWITPADLSCYDKKIITKGRKSITVIGLKNSSSRLLPKGSILFSSRAPIGYVAIAGNEVCTNQGFKSIIPDKSILSEYLFYFLKASKQNAEKVASGTTFKEISMKAFSQLEIPLPPLPEQQSIVAKIEELFSELDKGVESLKTAQQQLKVYRQSLLKWAFEGRLTSTSLSSRRTIRLLSEAETSGNIAAEEKEKYGNNELPKGWKWMKLDSVCTKIQDGSHFSPQVQYDEPGVDRFMYITAKNIRNDHMDFRKLSYVDRDFHESIFGRCNPEFGDVLLTKDGINTGEVTLNTLHEPFSLLSSVCIFKTKKEQLISPFLKYFIQSPFGNKAILNSMTGTAIKRIILRKIKDALIALPPLKEQQRIVDELESRLTVCDKIEKTINEGLQQSEALRQSILKRAFEGRLV